MIPARHLLFCCALLIPARSLAATDPAVEIAGFSEIQSVDLAKLATGEIATARGPAMKFERGLLVESCYFVPRPVSAAAALLVSWDPSRHPELKVASHGRIGKTPSAADFASLASAPGTPAPGVPGIDDLVRRAKAFRGGGLAALPPYAHQTGEVAPAGEASRLLDEAPKIRGRFAGALAAMGVTGSGRAGGIEPALYWDLIDVRGKPAVSLGAVGGTRKGDGWQGVAIEFYASDGFFVLLKCFEMWPVQAGSQPGTLVWRGDLLASPELTGLQGVEQTGSRVAVTQSIRRAIRAFQQDAGMTQTNR